MLPSKYVRYAEAKEFVSKLNFKTLAEYRKFVTQHHIQNLPKDPSATYAYKGFVPYEFLGLDKATYKANIREARAISFANRTANRPKNIVKKTQKVKTVKGLDPDMVIQFLMDENVEPETIVNFIAMMDISSGTLMSELCKYMAKRNLEKQQTWRPTGYNTSEAQISLKI
jgi:hypothetical protein